MWQCGTLWLTNVWWRMTSIVRLPSCSKAICISDLQNSWHWPSPQCCDLRPHVRDAEELWSASRKWVSQQKPSVLTILLDSISRDDLSFVLKFLFQRAKGSGEKLFQGLTLGAYNRAISDASRVLQIQSLKLTAHGLRHAGPSSDSLHRRRDINAIQQRGRWAAPSSVARYRKPGRMLLLHQQVPATVWNQSEKAYAKVISFFKSRSQRKNA